MIYVWKHRDEMMKVAKRADVDAKCFTKQINAENIFEFYKNIV